MVENSVIYTLSQSTNTFFCWCVLKRKKKSIMHCCRQLGTSYKRIFHPRAVLGGSLRRHSNPENWQRRGNRANQFHHFLLISGGSAGPAYHTRPCPNPADLLTVFLGLEGKPLRAPRVCWTVISKSRCYPFPNSQRSFGVTLRTT